MDSRKSSGRLEPVHMTNNERFNQLINSCANPRLTYNALLSLKPCVQQRDNAFEKGQIVIGKLLTLFDQAKSNQ